ncbi:winged helix-turn-helix transcriptional regulator [Luteolibacter ambystomatis]|uniref:Winged helix-turn-helix transcriptional regulator n=1 Tax=Luteolibacter ambystomatis TaxID=2824561 RepID=A0A975J011_9BACT|nr:winged helix-turn-helix domain-containing protein [Luteolibacter ambystomatis]QUE51195.1 winged helix-turn-helix transcriptional regulator [Luteolibacter ambystomatis]
MSGTKTRLRAGLKEQGKALAGARKPLALGHPVRWALIREVAFHGPLPVKELAQRLGVDRPALSSHLPQLLECGIVAVFPDPGGDARRRCIGLSESATCHQNGHGLEVDFGELVVRFGEKGE